MMRAGEIKHMEAFPLHGKLFNCIVEILNDIFYFRRSIYPKDFEFH